MRVYVVIEQHFSFFLISKIFSNEEVANAYAKQQQEQLSSIDQPEYDDWGLTSGTQFLVIEHEVE